MLFFLCYIDVAHESSLSNCPHALYSIHISTETLVAAKTNIKWNRKIQTDGTVSKQHCMRKRKSLWFLRRTTGRETFFFYWMCKGRQCFFPLPIYRVSHSYVCCTGVGEGSVWIGKLIELRI